MQSAAAQLPEDPVALRAEVIRLQDRLAESERQHEQRIQQLLDYITLLKRKRFGPGTDRIPHSASTAQVLQGIHVTFPPTLRADSGVRAPPALFRRRCPRFWRTPTRVVGSVAVGRGA